MKKRIRPSPGPLLMALLALLLPSAALALSAPTALGDLEPDDLEALETIATHDEDVRDDVLLVSQHVDVVVEAQRIQEQSSQRFRERIEELPDDLQTMVWDVAREPALMEELATEGPRSGAELDALVNRHPEALEEAIRTLGRSHYSLLAEILRIDRVAWERFDSLLVELPPDTQQAFRDLVGRPDLLTLLAQRVRLAVYLGDSYREDPAGTRRHLAELATELALREAEAEEQWRTAMESDPEAMSELETSARLYADEYGYTEEYHYEYAEEYDYDYLDDVEVTTTVQTVVHPYPYWFGYPSHYADRYLYPYGYWYHCPAHVGFYYGGGHRQHHHGHRHDGHGHHRVLSSWQKHKEHRDRYGHWQRRRQGDRSGWRSAGEERGVRERRRDSFVTRFGPRSDRDRSGARERPAGADRGEARPRRQEREIRRSGPGRVLKARHQIQPRGERSRDAGSRNGARRVRDEPRETPRGPRLGSAHKEPRVKRQSPRRERHVETRARAAPRPAREARSARTPRAARTAKLHRTSSPRQAGTRGRSSNNQRRHPQGGERGRRRSLRH